MRIIMMDLPETKFALFLCYIFVKSLFVEFDIPSLSVIF